MAAMIEPVSSFHSKGVVICIWNTRESGIPECSLRQHQKRCIGKDGIYPAALYGSRLVLHRRNATEFHVRFPLLGVNPERGPGVVSTYLQRTILVGIHLDKVVDTAFSIFRGVYHRWIYGTVLVPRSLDV
jgi:hypothetical protein